MQVRRVPTSGRGFHPLRSGVATMGFDLARQNGTDRWVDPSYNTIMATHLTIDKAGRVVIPKSLREELRLEPGDSLEMEKVGEEITLRPVRGTGPLTKEHGVWVFHSGQPLSASATDEMLRQLREERDSTQLGANR
jgi:AbrB family looped-hinge helix DNA binding protein